MDGSGYLRMKGVPSPRTTLVLQTALPAPSLSTVETCNPESLSISSNSSSSLSPLRPLVLDLVVTRSDPVSMPPKPTRSLEEKSSRLRAQEAIFEDLLKTSKSNLSDIKSSRPKPRVVKTDPMRDISDPVLDTSEHVPDILDPPVTYTAVRRLSDRPVRRSLNIPSCAQPSDESDIQFAELLRKSTLRKPPLAPRPSSNR
jgi:hypothetical protein